MADQFQYPKGSTSVFTATLPAVTVPVGAMKGSYPDRVDVRPTTQTGYTLTESWLSVFPTMLAVHGRYADQVLDVDAMTPY